MKSYRCFLGILCVCISGSLGGCASPRPSALSREKAGEECLECAASKFLQALSSEKVAELYRYDYSPFSLENHPRYFDRIIDFDRREIERSYLNYAGVVQRKERINLTSTGMKHLIERTQKHLMAIDSAELRPLFQ